MPNFFDPDTLFMDTSPLRLVKKVTENLVELCEMDERTTKKIGGELLTW